MSRKLLSISITATLLGGAAIAEVPNVAVDIAPVHSLVARVMAGVGEPDLIVPSGASPHEYNLRPSEAAALQEADLVFWMGEGLTPWMENALDTLAEDATVTTLLEADETSLLEFRTGALFEEHDHDDHDDHEKDHDHDDHGDELDDHAKDDDLDHDHEAAEEDHDDHGHEEEHAHDHGAFDPHAWLSPENAGNWLNLIAAQLSSADPDNAGAYFANATAARAALEALSAEVNDLLEPARGHSFVAFHDAYQYFETAFDIPAAGAISLSDASSPSPARVAEIQDRIRTQGIDCVLAEPQYNPGLVQTVLDGTEAQTGVIDPLGAELEPGADLYPQLIRKMAQTLADCL